MDPITHPPLSLEEFNRIADAHNSPDAILLLREIERLRVIEARGGQIAAIARASKYTWAPMVAGIVEQALEGRLTGRRRFGVKRAENK